jgi:ribulose-5-phosphate 4-epimerase/fuculose-1-phosphate aldolase
MSTYDSQRNQVWQFSQWLSKNGYLGSTLGSGGNVSFFDRDEEVIFITPSGKPYHEMSNEDICIINTNMQQLSGKLSPSIESSMHVGVYLKRPSVNAVVHTHQPFASVFALINKPIPALFDEVTLALGARVEIIPYALSGSAELVANVTKQLSNGASCYILQNHGALSLGRNLSQAVLNAETLEKVCQVYYHALCTGEPINRLPESAIQHWLKTRTRGS